VSLEAFPVKRNRCFKLADTSAKGMVPPTAAAEVAAGAGVPGMSGCAEAGFVSSRIRILLQMARLPVRAA